MEYAEVPTYADVEFFREHNSFGQDFEFEKVTNGRKVVGYNFIFNDDGWNSLPKKKPANDDEDWEDEPF